MPDVEQATERSHLLSRVAHDRRFSAVHNEADVASILSTHVSKEEQLLATTSVGERLPYNDYTTIDWLHDLVCITHPLNVAVLTSTGQGLLSISDYSCPTWDTWAPWLRFRVRSRMDRCSSNRHLDGLYSLLRRRRRIHRQRLEAWIL